MTIDELQVLITANTKQLQKEIANTNKTISSLQKSANKTQAGVMSSFSKLKTGIVALGIGKVIKDSITSGMNAVESESLFETSLDQYKDSVRSWSDEVSNALGLNAIALRKNTGTIYNMVTSMGLAEGNALKMSKGISLLTEDMASFYNLSSEEAFNKLRAGLTGETEPLKQLGILVDENTIKQVAYKYGIAQTGAELTQQQKVYARYLAILDQTKNAQGDLARTLTSPANQMRILKTQVSQLGVAFGNLLLPMLQAVIPYVTAFTKVVTYALNSLSTLLAKVFGYKLKGASSDVGKISSGFGGIANNVGDVSKGIGNVSSGIGDTNKGLKEANKNAKKLKGTLSSFDEMNVLQDNSTDSGAGASTGGGVSGIGGGGVGGIGGIDDGLFNLGEYDANLDGLSSKVDNIVEGMKKAFSSVRDVVKDIWNSAPIQAFAGAVTTYGQLIYEYWSQMGPMLLENITTTWDNISINVGTYLRNMTLLWTLFWTDVDAGLQKWGKPIIEGVTKIFNSIWKDAVDPALQMITKVWADFSGILVDLWRKHGKTLIDNIGGFVTSTIDLFQRIWDDIIEPIVTPFLETLSWLWDKHIKGMVKEFGDFVAELVNGALEIWNKCLKPVIDNLIEKLAPAWSFISSLIVGVMGTIIGVISDVISGVIKILKGIVQFLTGFFTGNWRKCWEGVKNIFGGIWDAIKGIAKGVVNAVIDILNAMISGINKIQFKVPNWVPKLGGERVGLNVPKIPKLARGGVVDSPTIAEIGEAGKEVVMPLERNTGWIDQLASKINSKGNSNPTQIVVKIGEDTIYEKFIDFMDTKNFENNGEVFNV